MCLPAAIALLMRWGRRPVDAALKYTVSSGLPSAASRSVVQRESPLAAARAESLPALRPTRIGSGITRLPSASATPPWARIAPIERTRCWFVPILPVTPFMMTPSRTVSTSILLRMFRGCEGAGGLERSPVGVRARRVARSVERGEPQLAIADGNAHRAAAACVEVGMRREKSLLLGFARALAGEAVHVMMAVA